MFNGKAILFALVILCGICSGCATVPRDLSSPAAFNLSGTQYSSLSAFCQSKGINWKYDGLTRSVVLNKGIHKISLQIGNNLAVIDGSVSRMKEPVEIYSGAIVIPHKFREQVLEPLFKEQSALKPRVSLAGIRKAVIDAGHGGKDPGALGKTGLKEKDVTLDIARRLAAALKAQGVETVMTRSSDKFIPLPDRVAITNNASADIFISIHANANRARSLSGFEVYHISQAVPDIQKAAASAKTARLNLDRGCFASGDMTLKTILWDMIYNYNRGESIELSRILCRDMDESLDARIIGVKSANFFVLRGANIPAVLIEVGFVSNGNEEKLLRSGSYRQTLAEGIEKGLADYCSIKSERCSR